MIALVYNFSQIILDKIGKSVLESKVDYKIPIVGSLIIILFNNDNTYL